MYTGSKKLSLRGLRMFCVAGRHSSFSQAAGELFVSASAISHQIRNLERELQTDLFVRRSQSIQLTDAGALLFEEIDPLIRRIDAAAGKLASRFSRRELSISVQPFFASEMFVPRLPDFTAEHPDIDIHVETSDEAPHKLAGDCDVSIRLFRSAPSGFLSERLFSLRLVPAASPGFRERWLAGDGEPRDFPLIVHASRPGAWRDWAEVAGRTMHRARNVVRLNSMIAVARAAERGLGAALVPLPLSEAWFESGSLVRLFDCELALPDAYYFAYRKEDNHRDDVQALRRWTFQTFADQPENFSPAA